MATQAYKMFTMDKLAASAAKQLVAMVHEVRFSAIICYPNGPRSFVAGVQAPSIKLRALWEQTQAKALLYKSLYEGAERTHAC
jgi:hypothetical protein